MLPWRLPRSAPATLNCSEFWQQQSAAPVYVEVGQTHHPRLRNIQSGKHKSKCAVRHYPYSVLKTFNTVSKALAVKTGISLSQQLFSRTPDGLKRSSEKQPNSARGTSAAGEAAPPGVLTSKPALLKAAGCIVPRKCSPSLSSGVTSAVGLQCLIGKEILVTCQTGRSAI